MNEDAQFAVSCDLGDGFAAPLGSDFLDLTVKEQVMDTFAKVVQLNARPSTFLRQLPAEDLTDDEFAQTIGALVAGGRKNQLPYIPIGVGNRQRARRVAQLAVAAGLGLVAACTKKAGTLQSLLWTTWKAKALTTVTTLTVATAAVVAGSRDDEDAARGRIALPDPFDDPAEDDPTKRSGGLGDPEKPDGGMESPVDPVDPERLDSGAESPSSSPQALEAGVVAAAGNAVAGSSENQAAMDQSVLASNAGVAASTSSEMTPVPNAHKKRPRSEHKRPNPVPGPEPKTGNKYPFPNWLIEGCYEENPGVFCKGSYPDHGALCATFKRPKNRLECLDVHQEKRDDNAG
jgi:hypothetical protein